MQKQGVIMTKEKAIKAKFFYVSQFITNNVTGFYSREIYVKFFI